MSGELRQAVAVVTGSSTGIGASTAIAFAKNEYDVVIHGRSVSPSLQSIAQQIEGLGRECRIVTADFSSRSQMQAFADDAWKAFGYIDVLVNNAGGDVLTGARTNSDFESKLDYLLAVDVIATLSLSREIGRKMVERFQDAPDGRGRCAIVNIGWDQAAHGMAGDSGEMFATTKGAIMSMSKSLAQTLAPVVRVNCVAPGWIQTAWGQTASADWASRAVNESLMRRWGAADDVAAAILFLAGPQASFISGQIVPVNGGFNHAAATRASD